MENFENLDISSLAIQLSPLNYNELDPHLAEKINIDYIRYGAWFIHIATYYENIPLFNKKVNELVYKFLEDSDNAFNISYYRLNKILDNKNISLILSKWISLNPTYIIEWAFRAGETDLCVETIKKIIDIYNDRKSRAYINYIKNIFININNKDLFNNACNLLSDSTPAVKAILLCREDIDKKFVLNGLKALSKLSSRKRLNIKIDINNLLELSPKTRLNAMKHLIDSMYYYRTNPFSKIPTDKEIKELLFTCSFKYNEQTSSIIKKFEYVKTLFN